MSNVIVQPSSTNPKKYNVIGTRPVRHDGADKVTGKAMAAAVMVLGSALGPGLTGVLIDAGVGIEAQYLGVAGYFVFASAMMAIGVTQARPGLSVAV